MVEWRGRLLGVEGGSGKLLHTGVHDLGPDSVWAEVGGCSD